MKKLIKHISFVLLSIFTITLLLITILSILYSPRYVYRLVRYNVADVYDYTHFENRVIEASDDTFSFSRKLDDPYVESLFQPKLDALGFSSLNK